MLSLRQLKSRKFSLRFGFNFLINSASNTGKYRRLSQKYNILLELTSSATVGDLLWTRLKCSKILPLYLWPFILSKATSRRLKWKRSNDRLIRQLIFIAREIWRLLSTRPTSMVGFSRAHVLHQCCCDCRSGSVLCVFGFRNCPKISK